MSQIETKGIRTEAAKWVDKYGDALFGFAILRLNNKTIAEDLIQETFLSAFKSYDSFKHQSSELTWLTGILKNKIIDYYRKNKAISSLSDSESTNEITDFIKEGKNSGRWHPDYTPKNWNDIPDKLYEQSEFRSILQKCLFEVPDQLRVVFTMRVIDGVSSEDVRKELSISSSNFWVIMHRARSLLRKCLENNWFGKVKGRM